jgi:predicted dehydrogenase
MRISKQYKAAIIGCGAIASGLNNDFNEWPVTHVAAYRAHPGIKIIGVSDVDLQKADECARKWHINKYYQDYQELMESQQPQIVSICTPYETHAQIIKEVVQHSCVKAIFCEKPLTNNLKDAKDVVELCEEKGVLLAVNFQRRHDQFYICVKERMDELVGSVSKVMFTYAGGISNNGAHAFDMLRYYFGDVKKLRAVSDEGAMVSGDPELTVFLEFKSGLKGILTSCKISKHSSFGMKIIGTEGTIDLINKPLFEYGYHYFRYEKSLFMKEITYVSDKQQWPIPTGLPRDLFVQAVDDIIASIEDNKEPISSARNGLASLELASAAIFSAKEGREIELPYFTTENLPQIGGLIKEWKKN